tara:strand:- start:298 stop:492 length:195 start_codon:yes stop_codon:yes gene_type:complete
MATYQLMHRGRVLQTTRDDFQTKLRGTNQDEYDIYLSCADNGHGMDITTGGNQPLKTFDEWLES